MNSEIRKYLFILMVLVYSSNFGQQESQFTQYMHIPQIFNPAYAGNRRIMSLRTLARSQWLDLEGAPKTNLISFDTPIGANEKVGLGGTSALAQLTKKAQSNARKTAPKEESFRVVKNETPQNIALDHTFELERQIITILMLYGEREETFKDSILSFSEDEDILEEVTEVKAKVFEKIFLDLQQDEVELANANFKTLFYLLIQHFQVEGQIAIDKLIPTLDGELSSLVSNILMNEDQYQLHDWEKKNIFVKPRDSQVPQLVNETILTLRKLLIDKRIEELQSQVQDKELHHAEILEEVMSYYQLKQVVSKKLNRVI